METELDNEVETEVERECETELDKEFETEVETDMDCDPVMDWLVVWDKDPDGLEVRDCPKASAIEQRTMKMTAAIFMFVMMIYIYKLKTDFFFSF